MFSSIRRPNSRKFMVADMATISIYLRAPLEEGIAARWLELRCCAAASASPEARARAKARHAQDCHGNARS